MKIRIKFSKNLIRKDKIVYYQPSEETKRQWMIEYALKEQIPKRKEKLERLEKISKMNEINM